MRTYFLACLVLASICMAVPGGLAQEEGSRARRSLSKEDQQKIVSKAEGLLAEVKPAPSRGAKRESWKVMEQGAGTVRWGNLFRKDETAALVNVKEEGEDSDIDPLPHYLLYFVWKKDQWEFRQFLGNAYDLELHYRKDQPEVYLQGLAEFGKNDGEYMSWFFDGKTGRLEPTHFEDWGPFQLKGEYLVASRGFERLAHDETFWVYSYKGGRKGPLLARFHARDNGDFDITFPEAGTGRWRGWMFRQDQEDRDRMEVLLIEDKDGGKDSELELPDGETAQHAEIEGEADPANLFGVLTGLNPSLLEDGWTDKSPSRDAFKQLPLKIKGDPEIVKRLQGRYEEAMREKEQRVLGVMNDIVPGDAVGEPRKIRQQDIRGVWGRLFGEDIRALVALGMGEDGERGHVAELYSLKWDGGWKIEDRLGSVSGEENEEGATDWTIQKAGIPPVYYVLSTTFPAFPCVVWRYDSAGKSLVSTGWPARGVPSISEGAITFSDTSGNDDQKEVFRFDGEPGNLIGVIPRTPLDGGKSQCAITVLDEHTGEKVTWRISPSASSDKSHAETYDLSRGQGDTPQAFHQDATIAFDWGDGAGSNAEVYLWSRLTGLGENTFLGRWDDGVPAKTLTPKRVTVTGLPEAVERFSWPPKGR